MAAWQLTTAGHAAVAAEPHRATAGSRQQQSPAAERRSRLPLTSAGGGRPPTAAGSLLPAGAMPVGDADASSTTGLAALASLRQPQQQHCCMQEPAADRCRPGDRPPVSGHLRWPAGGLCSQLEISCLHLYVVQERKFWTSSDMMSVMREIEAHFLDSPIMLTSAYDCQRAGRGPVTWVLSPLQPSDKMQ